MVFGIDDALMAAGISALPNLLFGGIKLAREAKYRKEEKGMKAADLARAYSEDLQRSYENVGALYAQSEARSIAGGLRPFYTGELFERKKQTIQSNLFAGYGAQLSALGYKPKAVGMQLSYSPTSSSKSSGGGLLGSIARGIGSLFGG